MKSCKSPTVRVLPLALAVAFFVGSCKDHGPQSPQSVPRQPKITPDYIGLVIPPNIAPLNFVIEEPGNRYAVRIHSASGTPIEIVSEAAEIIIPPEKWKSLLSANAGRELQIDVCLRTEKGQWNRYETIRNTIAAEAIDSYLVYRFMTPSSYFPKPMQIRQRHLESFAEETLLDTQSFGKGCANCHSFVNNHPDPMLLGIRSTSFPSATAYVHAGRVAKIGAKFGYTAWHPSGRLAAYSINDVRQFFHTARAEIHDVVDLDSLIVYYDFEKNETKTAPALSDKKRLETYPAWAPDGRYLYFCSAPLLWGTSETVPPPQYKEVQYDLMRIRYDVETDTWGTLETVLSAAQTGQSILLPRVSPDGRFLLFCMSQYGCFPVYQPTSDLFLMDLQTGQYRRASINSEYAESWHSWSSNSRWIVFSSKRQGGLFTRPFLSYVDANGETHKAFVLPQRHPSFYKSCYDVYSVPELITESATVDSEALVQAITCPTQISVNSVTGATPKASSTDTYTEGQPSVQ